ncbi:MAG: PTS sugar transporter subunit IIA [Clostridiales bacterium]
MDISKILIKENIFLNLDVKDREECLNVLIDRMEEEGFINNKDEYYKSVLTRESTGSTAIGFNVAIPHGKSDGIKLPVLSFARTKNPIDWNSLDGEYINMVFLIGVPEKNSGNEHIKILMSISRKLVHDDFRKRLLNAKTENEIISIIGE